MSRANSDVWMVCFSSLRGLPSFSTLEPQTQPHVQAEGREERNAYKKNPHKYTRIDFSSNDVRSEIEVSVHGETARFTRSTCGWCPGRTARRTSSSYAACFCVSQMTGTARGLLERKRTNRKHISHLPFSLTFGNVKPKI